MLLLFLLLLLRMRWLPAPATRGERDFMCDLLLLLLLCDRFVIILLRPPMPAPGLRVAVASG